jgi:hypothetical protein
LATWGGCAADRGPGADVGLRKANCRRIAENGNGKLGPDKIALILAHPFRGE